MFSLVGIIVLMSSPNPRLTLVTLISLPVVMVRRGLLGKVMRNAYWDVQQSLAAVNTGVEQGVAGMKVAQSLWRKSFTVPPFERLSLGNMKVNLRVEIL